MGMIPKDEFAKWIKKQTDKGNWLQINEVGTREGRQVIYMTFSGQFVVVQHDIKGDITMVGQPTFMPAPMPQGSPALGFKPR